MVTHASIPAWIIPRTEEPKGLQSQELGHNLATKPLPPFSYWASQVVLVVKNPPATSGRRKRLGFDPWVGKIPWRRAQQITLVLLPRESHGERSLVGCCP